MKTYNEYTFFWNGPFSNWYPCKFTDIKGIEYNCSEQYMMYHKALLFCDYANASRILETDSPKEQKQLGRSIKKFDPHQWSFFAKEIVWVGCYHKFTQNQILKQNLLDTDGTLLVEASPYDCVWGLVWGRKTLLLKTLEIGKAPIGWERF